MMDDPMAFAQLQEAAVQDINHYLLRHWKTLQHKLVNQSRVLKGRRRCSLKAVQCNVVFNHSKGAQKGFKSTLETIQCALIQRLKVTQRSCKSIFSKKEVGKTYAINPPKTTAIFVVAEGTVEVVAPLVIYSDSGSWKSLSQSNDVPNEGWFPAWRCHGNDSTFGVSDTRGVQTAPRNETEPSLNPWCFGNLREDDSLAVHSFVYETVQPSETTTSCSSSNYNSLSNTFADENTKVTDCFACSSPCHMLSPRKKHTVVENEILVSSRDSFSKTSSLSSTSSSGFLRHRK